ncbi:MAG: CotH kinase family protein, partial [Schleiferiaceae bacterium]
PVSVTTAANTTRYYTTNGDEPDQNDPVVNGLIYVSQTSVLSVKSFGNNGQAIPSPTIDRTYIIDEDNHNLPVVSIITDEDHLWDWNTGIYVMGPNASTNYPYFGSNFWEPWSRKSRMEFFDRNQNKQFEAVFDLEIHGGWSRAEPQKSFRIDAKSTYTGDVEYPLIERKPEITSFNNFNLRNGGQHGIFNRIQDAVFSRLADGTHIDRMGYQATLVYLNGEFWGLYGIREKFDEHYVESNHGVDKDAVQLLNRDGALVGDASHFNESYNIITNQSANSPNFVEVFSSRFDLNNYLDYFIFETYIQNRDWMGIEWGINNVKLWRQDTVGATWRYMMYDTDFGFALYGGSIYHNYINRARNPDYPNQHSQIFNHALNNADFRCRFVNRYDDLINTTFQTDVFNAVVDELKTELAPAIPDHIAQWSNQMGPYSYTYWLNSVNGLKTYNSTRIPTARQHINQSFNLQGQKLVELAASPTNSGHIKVNSILPPLPWDGIYHGGCPITTEAIPSFGYLFSHWTSDDGNYQNAQDATIQVALSDNTALTAHFQPCEAVISASILEAGNQLHPQVSEEVNIYAYEWRLNGALVSEDSVLYNPVDGDYTLVVRFDSCEISSEAFGISRGDYELLLFPNPAMDVLRIQFVLGEEAPLELALF